MRWYFLTRHSLPKLSNTHRNDKMQSGLVNVKKTQENADVVFDQSEHSSGNPLECKLAFVDKYLSLFALSNSASFRVASGVWLSTYSNFGVVMRFDHLKSHEAGLDRKP